MKQKIKHLLFAALMLMMVLPFIQQHFNFPKVRGLKGYFAKPIKPKLSAEALLHSAYQDSMNLWLEDNIGYRPDLVRLYNQFRATVFDTLVAQGVILGKEGYLFELNYIKALYGLDFVGEEKVQKDIEQTKFVNEWLQKHNKHLLVVMAPGKATFFPEFVPESYKPDTIGPRNNDVYQQAFTENSIPFIDGNKLFLSMKDSCRYALYPKCGIHWSYYGLGIVFDTILQSMKQMSGKNFVDFGMKSIEVSHKLRSPDRDLWEGLNIFVKPNDYAMPYPVFSFENAQKDSMPSVIVVADSYYWQWFGGGYASRSFKKHEFWYYNKQVMVGDGTPEIERHHVDLMLHVMESDFIVLLQTDANMPRYSFGFIDDLTNAIQKLEAYSDTELLEIRTIIERIRSSESYMESIKEKAIKRNISVDEMLRLDATWVFENKRNMKQ